MDPKNFDLGARPDKTNSASKRLRYPLGKLNEFKKVLEKQLKVAREDYFSCKNSLTHEDGNDTQDTSPTFKVLEEGAATLAKEEAGKLAQHQFKKIRHLEAAIIACENGSYGVCKTTGSLIPEERLRACPLATTVIEVKPR